ncbi:LysR family transcriptional regulator [Glaciecola sp. MH2013]|nr:LysR family transcriptional regulator [Glaciecola sp. MH2013]
MFMGVEEFVALGQTHNFSSAAKRLGVSTSLVSRRVAALEEKMGVRLVNRTTRVVKLTDAGYEYFNRCSVILQEMEEANSAVVSESQEFEGRIRVSAAGDYAERFVGPSLARFAMQHPKLQIEMDFNSRNVNLIDDGFDFAIRYGELSDSSLVARPLTTRNLVAAASPTYIKKYGVPKHPNDLAQHRCIISVRDTWHFNENGNALSVKVPVAFQSNSGANLVATALTGLGIVYLPQTTLQESLNNQGLVSIMESYCATNIPTWLVYPSKRFLPRRVRAALDFLQADLKSL